MITTELATKENLKSSLYEELMNKYMPEDRRKLDHRTYPRNYQYRHTEMPKWGAWRWMPIYENRHFLIDLIFSDKKGIDFGGFEGPIGGNTIIVDKVTQHTKLEDIEDDSLDYIFTSNVIEHFKYIGGIIAKLRSKLKKGGLIVATVPSYIHPAWRAGNHGHKVTFSLEEDTELHHIDIVDAFEFMDFKVLKAEYTGDSQIFLICEKL